MTPETKKELQDGFEIVLWIIIRGVIIGVVLTIGLYILVETAIEVYAAIVDLLKKV